MPEYRFYSESKSELQFYIEPWGTEYIVPRGSLLKVVTIGSSELTEIRCRDSCFDLYFNGPEINEEETRVLMSAES